jgi:branched-chain amino acid transport system permease protein
MARSSIYIAAIGVLCLFLWYANAQFTDYRLQLVILVAINIVVAVSLTMANGFTGVFSLGQVGFMAIGAYVGALISLPTIWKDPIVLPGLPSWLSSLDTTTWPHWLALVFACLAGGIVATVVSVVVGYPLMRLSGNYVAVATLGFLIIVNTVLIQWDSVTYGSQGLNPIPTYANVWSAYAWAVIAIYAAWRVKRSSFGRSMIASRDNLIAAQAIGIRVHRARLLAFCLSSFLTGVGGCLLAHQIGTVAPNAYYFTTTFNIIIMVVLGGLGSVSGAVFGAIFMTLAPEYLRDLETNVSIGPLHYSEAFGLSQIILAVVFIVVMILRPKGLLGDRELDLAWWLPGRKSGGDVETVPPREGDVAERTI